jgi:preprotein translocase subunit SecD
MLQNLKWRAVLYTLITVVAVVYLLPTFVKMPGWWEEYLPSEKISLGLDLQGGMHLVLGVETQKAVENTIERDASDIEELYYNERIPFDHIKVVDKTRLEIQITDPAVRDKASKLLEERFPSLKKTKVEETKDGTVYLLEMDKKEADHIKKSATEQALETIRNRIDQFGVAEPSIQQQGEDRIVIQLPGIKDPKRAVDLIGKTALLEFKVVDDENSVDEALKGKVPLEDEILYQREVNRETGEVKKTPFLLKKKTVLSGDRLVDAQVRIDTQFNEPYVSLEFDARGAKLFEKITEKYTGKRLAIILDNNVYSAPVIKEKIAGGHAQITGRFSPEEARDLAIVLRAGSLPAPVIILEKRTVGPSLGQDSIQQGIRAMLIGSIAVILFMVFYYRLSGIIANIALVLNIILLLAVLAGFRATLTVPGLAGIVLTIGMAVDANVLIHERIREEMRSGKTMKACVDTGYTRAFMTIMDSNLTTIIAAIFLFQFGTGPVKGFAITLTIGLLANMFTAVAVTRLIFDYFVIQRRIKTLSI